MVRGGWVQNDEASSHPVSVIDQITEGHDYILKNFGVRPRIGWQIDPFGHSAATPQVFREIGLEAMVINRIHFSLKADLKAQSGMEFLWKPSQTQSSVVMPTHVLHTHYSAPKGFDFEESWSAVPVHGGNVKERARVFVEECMARAQAYGNSGVLLVPWGDDFKFQNSATQWSQMDLIVNAVNAGNFPARVKYSTLSEYFRALARTNRQFKVYEGDFFPYADNAQAYWTGYFTSKPLTKQVIRQTMSRMRSAEAWFALTKPMRLVDRATAAGDFGRIRTARRALALSHHHDAVTGTSRAMVDEDYRTRMRAGAQGCEQVSARHLAQLLRLTRAAPAPELAVRQELPGTHPESPLWAPLDFYSATPGRWYPMVVSNSLGWRRSELIRVRVSSPRHAVLDSDGAEVTSQISHEFITGDWAKTSGDYELAFVAELPALGAATFFIVTRGADREITETTVYGAGTAAGGVGGGITRGAGGGGAAGATGVKFSELRAPKPALENAFLTVQLAGDGQLERITNKRYKGNPSASSALAHSLNFYTTTRSGSYIFNPDQKLPHPDQEPVTVRLVRGPVVHEVFLATRGITRRYTVVLTKDPYLGAVLHTELTRVSASANTEVVNLWLTSISNGRNSPVFYTDNGLEYRRRQPVEDFIPAKFYPVMTSAYLEDEGTKMRFTVLTEHSQGGSAQTQGALELMIHRQLNQDDGRGLSQPNNDGSTIAVRYGVVYCSSADAQRLTRRVALLLNNPVEIREVLADAAAVPAGSASSDPAAWVKSYASRYRARFSALQATLPDQVHILSLSPRDLHSPDATLRLHHIHESHEGASAASTAVNLGSILSQHTASAVRRRRASLVMGSSDPPALDGSFKTGETMSLRYDATAKHVSAGANQNTEEEGVFISSAAIEHSRSLLGQEDAKFRVTLSAGDLATFLITLTSRDQPRPVLRDAEGPASSSSSSKSSAHSEPQYTSAPSSASSLSSSSSSSSYLSSSYSSDFSLSSSFSQVASNAIDNSHPQVPSPLSPVSNAASADESSGSSSSSVDEAEKNWESSERVNQGPAFARIYGHRRTPKSSASGSPGFAEFAVVMAVTSSGMIILFYGFYRLTTQKRATSRQR